MAAPSRFQALSRVGSPAEGFRLAQYVLFAAAVPLMMRLRLPLLRRLMRCPVPPDSADPNACVELIQDVTRALRYGQPVVRRGCLARGMTLYYFLRRAGINVQLCFGARFRGEAFEAHCWLEQGGRPFLEEPETAAYSFRRIYCFPSDHPDDI